MTTSAGEVIFLLRATSPIALSKHADQPAANNCSGLVPMRSEPGIDSLTSSRPSELRDWPFSRPPVVWVLAVYTTLPGVVARSVSSWVMVGSLNFFPAVFCVWPMCLADGARRHVHDSRAPRPSD